MDWLFIGLKSGIKAWEEENNIPENISTLDEMVILFPESCQGKGLIQNYDPTFIKLLTPNVVIKQDRAGSVGRDYSVQLYHVTNPDNSAEVSVLVMFLNKWQWISVHGLYEMWDTIRPHCTSTICHD